jgi:hypothetical protein
MSAGREAISALKVVYSSIAVGRRLVSVRFAPESCRGNRPAARRLWANSRHQDDFIVSGTRRCPSQTGNDQKRDRFVSFADPPTSASVSRISTRLLTGPA